MNPRDVRCLATAKSECAGGPAPAPDSPAPIAEVKPGLNVVSLVLLILGITCFVILCCVRAASLRACALT